MVIIMETGTGKYLEQDAATVAEFDKYGDEVLNAGWLPRIETQLETRTHSARSPSVAAATLDADEFLRALYRNQE
jgi:hypothetical protein